MFFAFEEKTVTLGSTVQQTKNSMLLFLIAIFLTFALFSLQGNLSTRSGMHSANGVTWADYEQKGWDLGFTGPDCEW